jgi:hypothetical protein
LSFALPSFARPYAGGEYIASMVQMEEDKDSEKSFPRTKIMLAVALYAVHYNFCRIHQTLRVTPAMEAGLSTRAWDVEDIVRLMTAENSAAA